GGAEDDPFTLTKPYILVGSVVLLVAILFFFTKLPEVQEETDKEEKMIAPVSGTASMWRHPQFIRAIIAQFCYCAAQTGIFSFFINYVTEVDTSMTNIEASRILAFGGMALFMIGRLSGSFTMRWMSPARLLTWFALADAVCMALVVVSVGTVSLYALYLSFFFMSIMFPTIFALGLEGMGSYTKKASSYIVMGVAGGAFAPMLMGYIGADNMAVGFVIPLLSFLYILYFALRCKRE
ncbi:MFS transporter, partial [Parabacteroides johnsonii]